MLVGMDAFVIRDTHKLVAKLQQRGFSAQQAEGITDAIKEIDASELATKGDLSALEARFYKFVFTAMAAQSALIVGLIEILK
jgi:hypothetical protein